MIKAIVFDLDDTLYLEENYAFSGMTFIGTWVEENWGILGLESELRRLWNQGIKTKTFDHAFQNLEYEICQNSVKELVNVYRNHSPEIELEPDSIVLLNRLQNKYHLGLITDGYKVAQNNKIDALNLHKWFSKIIITDELGKSYWKPNPRSYKMIEAEFSCKGKECVYIGDNISKDFISANQRGWMTIQIQRPNKIHKKKLKLKPEYYADMIIDNLNALQDGIWEKL